MDEIGTLRRCLECEVFGLKINEVADQDTDQAIETAFESLNAVELQARIQQEIDGWQCANQYRHIVVLTCVFSSPAAGGLETFFTLGIYMGNPLP